MIRRSPVFAIGAAIAVALVVVAIAAPWIATDDPNFVPQGRARLAPGSEHWFGTDQLGRDVFSRIVYGTRTSLVVGLCSALVAGVVGVLVGLAAGWRRGWVDALLMRVTEAFLVIPSLLVASALLVVLGRGLPTIVLVLAIAAWPIVARVTRAEVIRVKQSEIVEASVISGAAPIRTLRIHVIPHIFPVVLTLVVAGVGTAILAESSLSFLGIGAPESTSSWGAMISTGRRFLVPSPHMILFPSAAVFVTILAFTLMALGLRSILRLRRT